MLYLLLLLLFPNELDALFLKFGADAKATGRRREFPLKRRLDDDDDKQDDDDDNNVDDDDDDDDEQATSPGFLALLRLYRSIKDGFLRRRLNLTNGCLFVCLFVSWLGIFFFVVD
jgi:hypothetical protein